MNLSSMSWSCLNALSCCHLIGWWDICVWLFKSIQQILFVFCPLDVCLHYNVSPWRSCNNFLKIQKKNLFILIVNGRLIEIWNLLPVIVILIHTFIYLIGMTMEHFPCTKTGQPGVGQILRWRGRKSTRTNPKVGYVGLVEKKKRATAEVWCDLFGMFGQEASGATREEDSGYERLNTFFFAIKPF